MIWSLEATYRGEELKGNGNDVLHPHQVNERGLQIGTRLLWSSPLLQKKPDELQRYRAVPR